MKDKNIFIAVEGPIGAGKTTLANLLNEHFGYTLLREIVEENPFLAKFYTNINEYALQTEAFFLFNRVKQLEDIQNKPKELKDVTTESENLRKEVIKGSI